MEFTYPENMCWIGIQPEPKRDINILGKQLLFAKDRALLVRIAEELLEIVPQSKSAKVSRESIGNHVLCLYVENEEIGRERCLEISKREGIIFSGYKSNEQSRRDYQERWEKGLK